jgi:hypothetical protein
MAGTYKNDNVLSGSIKCGEFLDQLRNGWLLKDAANTTIKDLYEQFCANLFNSIS